MPPELVVTEMKMAASELVKLIVPAVAAVVLVAVACGKIVCKVAFNLLIASTPCCSEVRISARLVDIIQPFQTHRETL